MKLPSTDLLPVPKFPTDLSDLPFTIGSTYHVFCVIFLVPEHKAGCLNIGDLLGHSNGHILEPLPRLESLFSFLILH